MRSNQEKDKKGNKASGHSEAGEEEAEQKLSSRHHITRCRH